MRWVPGVRAGGGLHCDLLRVLRVEAAAQPPCPWCLQVRLRLEAAGILMLDTPQGTTWKPGPRLNIAEEENAAAESTPAPV